MKFTDFYHLVATPIVGVSIFSIILLVFFSPVYSVLRLVFSSFWVLYLKNYKSIFHIWFITLTIWYLIFTATFQTITILDVLSSKLGYPIYIPAFIDIIKAIIDFFK